MLREKKAFAAVLTKFGQKAKEEEIVQSVRWRHTMEGDNQIFLSSYAQKCNQENVDSYFR